MILNIKKLKKKKKRYFKNRLKRKNRTYFPTILQEKR